MCSKLNITPKNKYILEYLGYLEEEDQNTIYILWKEEPKNSEYKLFDDYLLDMLREYEIAKHNDLK